MEMYDGYVVTAAVVVQLMTMAVKSVDHVIVRIEDRHHRWTCLRASQGAVVVAELVMEFARYPRKVETAEIADHVVPNHDRIVRGVDHYVDRDFAMTAE